MQKSDFSRFDPDGFQNPRKGELLMRNNLIKLTVAVLCMAFVFTGCAHRPPQPVSDDAYPTVPFAKIVNPAFAYDYGNQWVRFDAQFVNVMDNFIGLPIEYQDGNWIRVIIQDDSYKQSFHSVISKHESDIVFNLKPLDRIEVFAYLLPVTLSTKSRKQPGILVEACKIKAKKTH